MTNLQNLQPGSICDHCGGHLVPRAGAPGSPAGPARLFCERCHCQWTPEGKLLRSGRHLVCLRAVRASRSAETLTVGRKLWLPLASAAFLLGFILWYGGLALLEEVLPASLGAIVALAAFRIGRHEHWW